MENIGWINWKKNKLEKENERWYVDRCDEMMCLPSLTWLLARIVDWSNIIVEVAHLVVVISLNMYLNHIWSWHPAWFVFFYEIINIILSINKRYLKSVFIYNMFQKVLYLYNIPLKDSYNNCGMSFFDKHSWVGLSSLLNFSWYLKPNIYWAYA